MLESNANPSPESSAAPAEGSPSPATSADNTGSAPSVDGAPAGQDGGSGDGRSRGTDGKFTSQAPDSAPAPVSVRSLAELAEEDPSTYSPAERKKVRLSAQKGIQDDAALDAMLNATGKPAAPKQAPKTGEQAPEGAASPDGEPGKDPANQPLHKLVKAISPYLDPNDPEKALENIKTLHTNIHTANTRVKELEGYYSEVESGIESFLKKGPEGVREMYKRFNLNPDEYLRGAAPAAAPAAAPNGVAQGAGIPQDAMASLASLQDDDFLPVAQAKNFLTSAITQMRREIAAELKADFEKTYGPLKKSHEQITEAVRTQAEIGQARERRSASLKDAQFHSDYYGDFYPEYRLEAPVQKVWDESVQEVMENGRPKLVLKSQQHPEWKKLETILKFRQKEFLESGTDAANYQDFLFRRVNTAGNFSELLRSREQRAAQRVIESQNKRLQPPVAQRGHGGPLDTFRVPKSEEDVQNMTPEQRREFKQMVLKGKIAVST